MALDRYQVIDAYKFLKKIYNDINNEDDKRKQHFKIEEYSNQLYRIDANLKILRRFLNSTYEMTFKDDPAKLYNDYKVLLKKFYYYTQHKEDVVLRNAVDVCNRVVFK